MIHLIHVFHLFIFVNNYTRFSKIFQYNNRQYIVRDTVYIYSAVFLPYSLETRGDAIIYARDATDQCFYHLLSNNNIENELSYILFDMMIIK